jgi:HCOMODA/2-hydroxy-3-carboxy-muconic semialdehyde decarboxylase
MTDRAAAVADLVAANHILFTHRVVDGFGHASVRIAPDRFLLARNMAPGLVTADDILTFDLDGEAIDAQGRSVYLERFIHGEIYRARPDVQGIVHSHAATVIPFGVSQMPLRPIFHMAGFLRGPAPIFEIRDHAGESSDLLIRNRELGVALAGSLGGNAVVLMRGHGATIVGNSLPQAVYRAVYTAVNAGLQSEALKLGDVTFLTEGEADAAAATNDGQLARAWDLWKRQAAEAVIKV